MWFWFLRLQSWFLCEEVLHLNHSYKMRINVRMTKDTDGKIQNIRRGQKSQGNRGQISQTSSTTSRGLYWFISTLETFLSNQGPHGNTVTITFVHKQVSLSWRDKTFSTSLQVFIAIEGRRSEGDHNYKTSLWKTHIWMGSNQIW